MSGSGSPGSGSPSSAAARCPNPAGENSPAVPLQPPPFPPPPAGEGWGGVEAMLLGGIDDFLRSAVTLRLRDELGKFWISCSRGLCQRMIRRDRHEFCAEQRVVPRGKNLQLALAIGRGGGIEREADQQSFGAADPVALHQAHLVGPAIQRIERVQQLLRIF